MKTPNAQIKTMAFTIIQMEANDETDRP
nr:TPA_asm: M72 uORF RNA *1 [Murid betaherpesvirus 1]DBA08016.1 TPA_asm: M72 uORF RNA *1 [Murid betaherpesvirus 1]